MNANVRANIDRPELTMMVIFTMGCILDHLTTYYGLKFPMIMEFNPIVAQLIAMGIWHTAELAIILLGNISGYFASQNQPDYLKHISIMALTLAGIFRIYAGIHNIFLIAETVT